MLVEYAGGMKFVTHHRGLEVASDQPESGGGENTALTPTELFVAALPMCVGVYLVPFARRHGIAVEGLKIEAEYEIADHPRRVGRIGVRIRMPGPLDERQRAALQRCAEQCLVHNTLHNPPEVSIELA
jgi:uncharacterized OsmC-like protein